MGEHGLRRRVLPVGGGVLIVQVLQFTFRPAWGVGTIGRLYNNVITRTVRFLPGGLATHQIHRVRFTFRVSERREFERHLRWHTRHRVLAFKERPQSDARVNGAYGATCFNRRATRALGLRFDGVRMSSPGKVGLGATWVGTS